jgi:hypothetical protein
LWIFGSGTTEVWYNSGATDYPLARISGAFVESGCTAARSVAKLDNALFWLGGDARGTGIVYRSNGYRGARISTHAIEWAIGTYGDVSNAVAFSYQQDGHSFYVLTFPTVDKTWCYDASTNLWHERASLITGELKRYKANCMCLFNGNIVVGDGVTGDLYSLDNTFHMDGADPLKWLRAWRAIPPGQNNLKRSAHHSLQIDVASGVGLIIGAGTDPVISLRWSDDGGHTWSRYHDRKIGKIGEYSARAIWHRLGMTTKLRDRVYEVSGSGTDPVPIAIMGAELNASPTNA